MELIIKPTELCNFACTFCSSSNIANSKKDVLSLDKVFEFLTRYPETSTIIVNGGDPLMMSPDYYFKILDFIVEKKMPTILSFTTNLWDFYLNPDRWTEIFRHPQVGVSTSFNYGGTRLINRDREFTEEIFWKVSDLFLERVGYRPDFISVIDESNEHLAIENVRLAQKMGVECKLNYAMASGRQNQPMILSHMFKYYLEIAAEGLTEWEFNTKEIINSIKGKNTICPRSRNCDEGIRCLQPNGDYYSCGSFADDKLYEIDFDKEMAGEFFRPLSSRVELLSLKEECLPCPMFSLCNGCRKTVHDLKDNNLVERHCETMKKLAPKILQLSQLP